MFREAALTLALLAACARDWRTDMWYQPARQARETPRPEPAGSVPLFARLQLDDRDDAIPLRSPFPDDDASAVSLAYVEGVVDVDPGEALPAGAQRPADEEPERQQDQPDQRIENQRGNREGPADDEK